MLRKSGLLLAAAVLAAVPAAAQDEGRVNVRFGGGFTSNVGAASNQHFGDGGNLTAGVYVRAGSAVSFGAEYGWNGFGTKIATLTVTPQPTVTPFSDPSASLADFTYKGSIQYGAFNVLIHPYTSGKARPYFIGGVGAYYRPVKVDSTATGYLTACDPALYMCYPTPTSVDQVVGTHSSTDVGINVGGGVDFKLGSHAAAFFEARYHYIWGPTINQQDVPAGTTLTTLKSNGEFIPITVGVRF